MSGPVDPRFAHAFMRRAVLIHKDFDAQLQDIQDDAKQKYRDARIIQSRNRRFKRWDKTCGALIYALSFHRWIPSLCLVVWRGMDIVVNCLLCLTIGYVGCFFLLFTEKCIALLHHEFTFMTVHRVLICENNALDYLNMTPSFVMHVSNGTETLAAAIIYTVQSVNGALLESCLPANFCELTR